MTELVETAVGTGWYVYGVVPAESPSALLGGALGVDPAQPVVLLAEDGVAAVASGVLLDEFGEAGLDANLRDEAWLQQKACAHEAVLEAALGRVPLVPFRFGTIYRSAEHVRAMLREHAFGEALARLAGTVELGVKALLDVESFGWARAGDAELAEGGGRAYLMRKQRERWLKDCRSLFGSECAHVAHERLTAAAEDGRANPPRQLGEPGREMILNGAYLVRTDGAAAFAAELSALEASYACDGVRFELTGPWPPYNFVSLDLSLHPDDPPSPGDAPRAEAAA